MTIERIVATGTIQGNTVVLDNSVPLPEGTRVTLTLTLKNSGRGNQERAFYLQLEAEGLISLPHPSPEGVYRPEPISIRGKPLSEIIIEERR